MSIHAIREDRPSYDTIPRKVEPYVKIRRSVCFDVNVSDAAVRLYGALLFHHNRTTGLCCPSHETLAKELGKNARTISRLAAELEDEQWITRSTQTAGGVTHYQFPNEPDLTTPLTNLSSLPLTKMSPGDDKNVDPPPDKNVLLTRRTEPEELNQITDQGQLVDLVDRPNEKSQPKSSSSRRHKIPTDWSLSDQGRQSAIDKGLNPAKIDGYVQEFVDYWVGDGRPKANWEATWRNRVTHLLERQTAAEDRTAQRQPRLIPTGTSVQPLSEPGVDRRNRG